MSEARQAWLQAHAYLEPLARFQAAVEAAAAAGAAPAAACARLEAWSGAAEGVPLLRSPAAPPEVAATAAELLGDMAVRLDVAALPGAIGGACREVRAAFERSPADRSAAIAWILRGAPADGAPGQAGLVRHLAWTAVRRALGPMAGADGWVAQERWGRPVCPACGAPPAMAQLLPGEPARSRLLACGCCGTRWRWQRIGCPFCDNDASDRMRVLHVDGDDALRIDVCAECSGYLKTYTGEGDEELFLADWPTLHLDVAAVARGLRRAGASLFELPDGPARS
jgi:FdhE protein